MQYILPLIGSFFTAEMVSYWFIPVLALGFVATVPCIIRQMIRR